MRLDQSGKSRPCPNPDKNSLQLLGVAIRINFPYRLSKAIGIAECDTSEHLPRRLRDLTVMDLVLINHSTIWDSPLTHLQKCSLGGCGNLLASTKTHERHATNFGTLTQLQHGPAFVAFEADTQSNLRFLKHLLKAALACAGVAAAAGAVPVSRDALQILGTRVRQPFSSPAAFMGYVYIFTCVLRFVEDALLQNPELRGTAIRRDYLAFYNWFAQRTGMIVPRNYRGVPHTTLIWTFLRNLGSDRMSSTVIRRGPTWWQIIFPTFLHVDPLHAWLNASAVWQLAALPIRIQVAFLPAIVITGALVNRISWAKARRTILGLQIRDQNPPAIYTLLRDHQCGRSEAWSRFKDNLRQGQLRGALASIKKFVRMSCRYSWLNDLNPGTGASGGLSFLQGFLISLTPTRSSTSLVSSVLRPTVLDLSQGAVAQTLYVNMAMYALEASQDALIVGLPYLNGVLRPTFWHAFATLNALRAAQWALASSPRVGHTAHLIGAALGCSCGLLLRFFRIAVYTARIKRA